LLVVGLKHLFIFNICGLANALRLYNRLSSLIKTLSVNFVTVNQLCKLYWPTQLIDWLNMV